MKRFYFRFGTAILCIVIGLLSVFGFRVYQEVMRSLNNTQALINPDKGKQSLKFRSLLMANLWKSKLMRMSLLQM